MHEEAGAFVGDDFRETSNVGGDDGDAPSHGEEGGGAEAFHFGDINEGAGRAEVGEDVAGEPDGKAGLADERVALGGVAGFHGDGGAVEGAGERGERDSVGDDADAGGWNAGMEELLPDVFRDGEEE
jgi:hypothetical protein